MAVAAPLTKESGIVCFTHGVARLLKITAPGAVLQDAFHGLKLGGKHRFQSLTTVASAFCWTCEIHLQLHFSVNAPRLCALLLNAKETVRMTQLRGWAGTKAGLGEACRRPSRGIEI